MTNQAPEIEPWLVKLANLITKRSKAVKHKSSKYSLGSKLRQTPCFVIKDAAKKKRKRKIAYHSRKINRMRAK